MTDTTKQEALGEVLVSGYLKHYGVKGMKWGVHRDKASYQKSREGVREVRRKKHSADEIKVARQKQRVRESKLITEDDKLSLARIDPKTSKKRIADLEARVERAANDMRLSDDRIIASKLTTGEVLVNALLTGYGSVAATNIINAAIDKDIARNR